MVSASGEGSSGAASLDVRSAAQASAARSDGRRGTEPLLAVNDLRISFEQAGKHIQVVEGVSFSVEAGRTTAIVGESGSGKSVTARAIMRLLPKNARVEGSVRLDKTELLELTNREMRHHRGRDISMVFQDPARSLNPTMKVGKQLMEAIRTHSELSKPEARERALDFLSRVRIPSPRSRLDAYPHQLSGGMRQRVMIAMALCSNPRLVIADEPTTALDVTTQGQIMELLADLQEEFGMAILLISHNMGIAANFTNTVAVMYSGRIVEIAPTEAAFGDTRMPYTKALLDAIPEADLAPMTLLRAIEGQPPDPSQRPAGCAFAPRCRYAQDRCHTEAPPLVTDSEDHAWACWFPFHREGV